MTQLLAAAQPPAGTSTVYLPLWLAANKKGTVSASTAAPAAAVASESTTSGRSGVKVLASLDDILNAHGLNVLNPIDDIKVIVARGAVIMVGLMVGVAGLIVLVETIGKTKTAKSAAKVAPIIGAAL